MRSVCFAIFVFGLCSLEGFMPRFQAVDAALLSTQNAKTIADLSSRFGLQTQEIKWTAKQLNKVIWRIAESDKPMPTEIYDRLEEFLDARQKYSNILRESLDELKGFVEGEDFVELNRDNLRQQSITLRDSQKNETALAEDYRVKVTAIEEQYMTEMTGYNHRAREFQDEIRFLKMGITLKPEVQQKLLNKWYNFLQKRNTIDNELYKQLREIKDQLVVTTDPATKKSLLKKREFFDDMHKEDTRVAEFALKHFSHTNFHNVH